MDTLTLHLISLEFLVRFLRLPWLVDRSVVSIYFIFLTHYAEMRKKMKNFEI